MADLLADVDAVNIKGQLGSSSINSVIRSYYSSGYKTRYTSFVESIAGNMNKSKFNSVVGNYTDDYWLWAIQKWPLLEGVNDTKNQSKAIRDAFSDFIW